VRNQKKEVFISKLLARGLSNGLAIPWDLRQLGTSGGPYKKKKKKKKRILSTRF
jgi:hypothetical protein